MFQSSKGSTLKIIGGGCTYKVHGRSPETFPDVEIKEPVSVHPVARQSLLQVLSTAISVVDARDVRGGIRGLSLTLTSTGVLRAVGTDAQRLIVDEVNLDYSGKMPELSVVIPGKAVYEMIQVLQEPPMEDNDPGADEESREPHIGRMGNVFLMKDGEVTITARIIGEKFPDYTQIIPEVGNSQVVVPREDFRRVLKRMAVLPAKSGHSFYYAVLLDVAKNSVTVSMKDSLAGEAVEKMETTCKGWAFSPKIQIRFLLELLDVMRGPFIQFDQHEHTAAFRVIDPDSPGFLALIMPIALDKPSTDEESASSAPAQSEEEEE